MLFVYFCHLRGFAYSAFYIVVLRIVIVAYLVNDE